MVVNDKIKNESRYTLTYSCGLLSLHNLRFRTSRSIRALIFDSAGQKRPGMTLTIYRDDRNQCNLCDFQIGSIYCGNMNPELLISDWALHLKLKGSILKVQCAIFHSLPQDHVLMLRPDMSVT